MCVNCMCVCAQQHRSLHMPEHSSVKIKVCARVAFIGNQIHVHLHRCLATGGEAEEEGGSTVWKGGCQKAPAPVFIKNANSHWQPNRGVARAVCSCVTHANVYCRLDGGYMDNHYHVWQPPVCAHTLSISVCLSVRAFSLRPHDKWLWSG